MKTRLALMALLVGIGCGDDGGGGSTPDLPTQAEIDDARARIDRAVAVAEQARTLLEELGILPVYECAEPEAIFTGDVADTLETAYGCATVTLDSTDPAEDVIDVSFPDGCTARGHSFGGNMLVRLAYGSDSMSLELDATSLVVDGHTVAVLAGYGTCADETQYWAAGSGDVPGHAGTIFAVDVEVAKRDGLPVIGGTTLIITGTGSVTTAGATDTISMTDLEYEIGDLLPKNGVMRVVTADGHTISASFSEATPLAREIIVTIDDHDPVTIYLPA